MDEIKAVATDQLAGGQLTLRGVAREVGMTVQSLYHYFPSREQLITALVSDAYHALAEAIDEARRSSAALPTAQRIVRVGLAYREWAVANRARFLLIYGTPVPGYQAAADGPTTPAARRLGFALAAAVFGDWSAEELGRIAQPTDDPGLHAALAAGAGTVAPDLPAPAFGLGVELWARMHGLVMLEILGHLPWSGEHAAAAYRDAVLRAGQEIERLRVPDPAGRD